MSLSVLLSRPSGRWAALAFILALGLAAILYATGATALAVGEVVRLTSKFRVMKPDLVTGVGLQESGATGRITAGPVKSSTGKTWWFVDFDSGVDGWVSANSLAGIGSSVAAPTLSFTAAPASIAPGATTSLSWSASNATSCTGTGDGFTGAKPLSGSASLSPSATTSFGLTCTGAGGSTVRQLTVTVAAPSASTPVVSLTASPSAITSGGSSTLSWSASNATACTASGDAAFSGAKATSGYAVVSPAASTAYSLTCTGAGGSGSALAIVDVGSGGAGMASAFADPDNGNIPDRAMHPIAFPTAVGFGRVASVRSPNAVVYKINSLADVADPNDGKITYRECALALAVNTPYAIPAGRPRYCVFDVSGAIVMTAPARITVPKLYIAGQTSPGGIEFRLGANYNPVDSLIDTRSGGDHMILRHVRTRTGEHVGRSSQNGDPIRLSGTRYQILDHVSTMFGTDESLDMVCRDCTVQWSIIGPNICRNAGHTSSLHCKSFFLKPAGNVTIAYNLIQHGEQRGLNAAVGLHPAAPGTAMQLDAVNNVIYHFVSETGLVSNQFGNSYANFVGNVNLRGPRFSAGDGNFLVGLYGAAAQYAFGFDIHAKDNVTPHTRIAGQFGQTVTDFFRDLAGMVVATNNTASTVCGLNAAGQKDCSKLGKAVVQDVKPAVAPGNAGLSLRADQIARPEAAMRSVLSFAGADQCRDGSCRDNVDKLYMEDVSTCDLPPYLMEKDWTSTVAASGGWAQLTQGPAKLDSDNDGMPDEWESRFKGTNPKVWDANADPDGDGYPNIEEYLNALAKDDVRYAGLLNSGTARVPAYNCNRPKAPVQ